MQWLVCHALIICMYAYTAACMNVYSNSLQVNIMNVSGETLYECSLSGKLAKVASLLAGGEKAYSHLVNELFSEDEIRKHIVDRVVTELDDECSQLCTHSKPAVFRQVPTTYMEEFKWTDFIQELQTRAPTLLRMLLKIVSHSDLRNKKKCGECHFPGVCMAVAVLLKERNKHMVGVQSLLSMIMFSARVDKLVSFNNMKCVHCNVMHASFLPTFMLILLWLVLVGSTISLQQLCWRVCIVINLPYTHHTCIVILSMQ